MKKSRFCVLVWCLLASFGHAEPLFDDQPLVRVRIINTLDTLNLHFNGTWQFWSGDSAVAEFSAGQGLTILKTDSSFLVQGRDILPDQLFRDVVLRSPEENASLSIAQVPFGAGWWWGGREGRQYEGRVHIYLDSLAAMCVTVELPLEEYLKGVVPYEIGGNSPREALKAQAVAARSEAVIALSSHLYSGEQHDLTSDVECQVFSGNHRRTIDSDRAVEDTRGLILSEAGQPINAFYASNCGGHAELIENVWPQRQQPLSYRHASLDRDGRTEVSLDINWRMRWWLRFPPRVYCNPALGTALPSWSSSNFRWTREFSTKEITDMLSKGEDLGRLKQLKVLKRGVSGRVYQAKLVFEKGERIIDGELTLRLLFSPSLRSSAFIVKKRWGRFILEGAGWGHGVGMCQSGAIAMAAQGLDFRTILTHYYSAAEIISIYPVSASPPTSK